MSGGDADGSGREGASGQSDPSSSESRREDAAVVPAHEEAQQRIESAREAARRRRRELGLPDLPADEVTPPKGGKRSAKRTKNHGQFMRQGSQ